ncbi:DDN1 protein, partial [Pedionomus torquatus]|nr:DDN1 protein [Pedionomus torquatus]
GRIIGGSEAKPHSWPYMAYLLTGKSTCGGFLIRADAVLSAAHCVAGETNITVILGAHDVTKPGPNKQVFHVGHWVIHPNYLPNTTKNDIVLLKLKPKAKLTKKVSSISFSNRNEHVKPGTKCKVAGWGRTSRGGGRSTVLMEVDLEVQSDHVCEDYFRNNYLPESMICAGDKNGKKAFSKGDSGGPFVCNGMAHGIVAYESKQSIFPEVFTRVSRFECWIREELRKFALQDLHDSPS